MASPFFARSTSGAKTRPKVTDARLRAGGHRWARIDSATARHEQTPKVVAHGTARPAFTSPCFTRSALLRRRPGSAFTLVLHPRIPIFYPPMHKIVSNEIRASAPFLLEQFRCPYNFYSRWIAFTYALSIS